MRKLIYLVLCAVLLCALLAGCGGTDNKKAETETEAFMPEGSLVRVEYSFYSGTIWGEDFQINVGPDKIYSAHYFPKDQDGYPETADIDDEAISPSQWSAIEEAVLRLVPALSPFPSDDKENKKMGGLLRSKIEEEIMDGGDKSEFYLTWEKDGEEKRIGYHCPNDSSFMALTTLLKDIADSAGSEKADVQAGETAEELAQTEVSACLHPFIYRTYKNYCNNDARSILDATWETIELGEDEAKEFPELSAALKKHFEEKEKAILADVDDNLDYAEEFLADMDFEPGYAFEFKRTVELLRSDRDVLSFLATYYEFTGGAHGMYGYGGYSFDAKTGKLLTCDDIFADKESLAGTISEKLVSMYGPDAFYDESTLTEYVGGCIDENSLVVALTGTGARVYFNPYDIAPYSGGAFMVDIDPKEYPGLIDPVYEEGPKNWIARLENNDTISVDLDMDGIAETVSYAEDVEYIDYGGGYYTETNGFTVYAGAKELYVAEWCYETEGYFIRYGDRSYLYIMCSTDNDGVFLDVIDLTGGDLHQANGDDYLNVYLSEIDWGWFPDDENHVNSEYGRKLALTDPENMMLFSRTEVLGTRNGYRMMHIDEDGIPVPNEGFEDYRFDDEYNEYTLLRDVKGKLLSDDGTETSDFTIPKGKKVKYIATDNRSYGDLKLSDGKIVRLYLDKGEEGRYNYAIDGIDLMDLFYGIIFAG